MREDNNKQQMESQRHSTKYMNNIHDRYFSRWKKRLLALKIKQWYTLWKPLEFTCSCYDVHQNFLMDYELSNKEKHEYSKQWHIYVKYQAEGMPLRIKSKANDEYH